METKEILNLLATQMSPAVFATVDAEGQPHARYINIGIANEKGIFFMTGQDTHFFAQLQAQPQVAITGMYQEDYLIQVVRIEGKVRPLGRDKLAEVLEGNAYVQHIYPDEASLSQVQVFQLYEGQGFYQSLTQGHKYVFEIKDETARAL